MNRCIVLFLAIARSIPAWGTAPTRKGSVRCAGRIVANVWNCDPTWRVEMRADGGAPVAMEPFRAIDPEAQALYADTSQLVHKWITVTPSDHYYTAPLPAEARSIEVIATDRFGKVYRSEKSFTK